MTQYLVKLVRFPNGERCPVLQRPGELPVHEATLFLNRFRLRGRASSTATLVCSTLAIVHREIDDPLEKFQRGTFLTRPELDRLASAAQYRMRDLADEPEKIANVISIHRVHPKLKGTVAERAIVDIATRATRLRYMAAYLEFLSDYAQASLPKTKAQELAQQAQLALKAFRAEIPPVPKRAKLGARTGLSVEEQDKLLDVVHPDSPNNPWKRGFVRRRNWVMVVVFLATGMRRGELLGLQIKDIGTSKPTLDILRRADKKEDPRPREPNTKTGERRIELSQSVIRMLWRHINQERHALKPARKYPQIFVSDEGEPLSLSSVDLIFKQLRAACPDLPVRLTSHVMRHTWNERFSEQADALGLFPEEEEKARNEQQGWSDASKTGATYTRRHTSKKGRDISLRMQQQLDEKIDRNK